jgi:hypothetical protein
MAGVVRDGRELRRRSPSTAMSYDIRLCDRFTGEPLHLDGPHKMSGGTYAVGGTTEAWVNITSNYGQCYYRVFGEKGIRTIYGMTGHDSIPVLMAAIDKLGDEVNEDYWTPTEGNAKSALKHLLVFAWARPDGVWSGD